MKFTDYFKLRVISRFIRKNFPEHRVIRQPIALQNATLIGIIFNASHYEEMMAAIEYSKNLGVFKKNIKLMGFVNDKKATSSFPFPFFTKSDLNWLKRPKCSQVDTFIDIEFDVLINLSTEVIPPLEFIAGASKAKFRIGLYTKTKLQHYDFLIQINENPSVEKLISNIENYLK